MFSFHSSSTGKRVLFKPVKRLHIIFKDSRPFLAVTSAVTGGKFYQLLSEKENTRNVERTILCL